MHPRFSCFSHWLVTGAALFALGHPTFVQAQSENVAAIVAGMREDIRILDERTRALNAEIEQLKRENRELREGGGAGKNVSPADLAAAVADLERAIRAGDKDVALQLTKQLERHATQVQQALDTLAKSPGVRPPSTSGPAFTPDPNYPKTGITYKVEAGDTLAGIAQRNNSSVVWIQSANMIADPRALQVGQTLFIPQK